MPTRLLAAALAALLSLALAPLALAPAAEAATSASAPTRTVLDADPGEPGPYAVVSDDYALADLRLPGLRRPVEVRGHVVEPAPDADTGPRPLVVLLHGRHESCYDPDDAAAPPSYAWPCPAGLLPVPSHLGYTYLQELLASQGFATVSVSANGVGAQDGDLADEGSDARARLLAAHLDHWTSIAAAHRVDLGRVVLVGHSRGGEGVDRLALRTPLDAAYRIVGQVLLAPTDRAVQAAPYVPTVTLLPYCDGDVADLAGQRYTDAGRDLVADDTALRSSVLVLGANHNFFNSEWTPGTAVGPATDDWSGAPGALCGRRTPERLTAAEQRAVASAYVAGAARLFTGDDAALPLLDGTPATVPSVGDADVRSHALGGGRDVRRPGIDASPTTASGGATGRLCVGATAEGTRRPALCGAGIGWDVTTPHWNRPGDQHPTRRFLEVAWTDDGAAGLALASPLDLRAGRLELRTIVDPARGPADLRVRLTDGAGASAVLDPVGGRVVDPLPAAPAVTRLWAQALLVDPAPAPDDLDLADVRTVELLGGPGGGRVWVADLAAAPDRLAPVPQTRLPRVDLGDLRVVEGDPAGGGPRHEVRRTARLPFTVTGPVTAPARFVVRVTGDVAGAGGRTVVDVAPGQTRGTIPVAYTADRLADHPAQGVVTAWAVSGVVTDDHVGVLSVADDDPAPRARVLTPRVVREGRTITVDVVIGPRAGYDSYVFADVVAGPGRALRGSDVPRSWLRGIGLADADRTRTLARLHAFVSATGDVGASRVRLRVPTLRDHRREGRETLTLVVHTGFGPPVRRTVRVDDVR